MQLLRDILKVPVRAPQWKMTPKIKQEGEENESAQQSHDHPFTT